MTHEEFLNSLAVGRLQHRVLEGNRELHVA